MKFFHLSDLHIGKHLFYYSLLEDQKYVFHQILEAAKEEQPDAVLLCGDIYDKTIPSAEAVSLFDWFLTELKETLPKALILIIAGNHDSGERLEFARELLEKEGVFIAGLPAAGSRRKDPKSGDDGFCRGSVLLSAAIYQTVASAKKIRRRKNRQL